jgi:hypothetical protein
MIDERNIVILDNAVTIAVADRSEAERLVAAMVDAGIVVTIDE